MVNLTKQEALDIVLKHLIKNYGQETGIKLFQDAGSKIFDYHGLAYFLGKEHLDFFCELYLHDWLFDYSDGKVPLSKTHYEIWDEMEDAMLNQNNTRNAYVMPRAFGKSSTISIPVALWQTLYGRSPYTIFASATDDLAKAFIVNCKDILEGNQFIEKSFGNIINKKLLYNSDVIELDLKPERAKIEALSATSGCRGKNYHGYRVTMLVLDDYQTEKQVSTTEGCAKMVELLNNGLMKTLQANNNHVLAVGTIQHLGDVYHTLLNSPVWASRIESFSSADLDYYFTNNKYWKIMGERIRKAHGDSVKLLKERRRYEEHKEQMSRGYPVIWEKYDRFDMFCEWLANPTSFNQEYQCNINLLAEKQIKSLAAIPAADMEQMPFSKTILSVDPASTTKRKSDYSAFCVLSENEENGLKYARKCVIAKLEFTDYINKIIELLLQFPDINVLSIEKQTYSGADVVKLREVIRTIPELANRPLTIINKNRSANKFGRIAVVVPEINLNRLLFNEDDKEAIAQIKEYRGEFSDHDDMIDAVADAAENLSASPEQYGNYNFLSFASLGIDI